MEVEGKEVVEEYNPCISCGACCAFFRASFYWGETDMSEGGTVPGEMVEKLNDFRVVMKGTNQRKPRCAALLGEIGESVRCSIYDLRASVCRDFKPSWENGIYNEDCDRARALHGLGPLEPWESRPVVDDDDEGRPKPKYPHAA